MGEDRRTPELNGLPFSTERIASRADYDRVRANFRWKCPEFFNFGFDVVDAGPLAEGWRYQRDEPAYVARQNADELRANLAAATRSRDR